MCSYGLAEGCVQCIGYVIIVPMSNLLQHSKSSQALV